MNSCQKGKRGERLLRDVFREHGFTARRGQQYAGGTDSPDVIVGELDWLHIECKVGNCNMTDAVVQASRDAAWKPWVVCHKPNNKPWRFVIGEELFFKFLEAQENWPPTPKGQRPVTNNMTQETVSTTKEKTSKGQEYDNDNSDIRSAAASCAE